MPPMFMPMPADTTPAPLLAPWCANQQAESDGVEVTSKRYLTRVIDIFGRKYDGPSDVVFKECRLIAAKLGGDGAVVFKAGPPKQRGRLFEKARMHKNHFDLIRDFSRAMFIVYNLDLIAPLLQLLCTAAGFHVARGKNRFALEYDASDSAGYRDFQILVRTTAAWLVELQIIPAQMYSLKETLGHSDYTLFRFAIEAGKRARAEAQLQITAGAATAAPAPRSVCAYVSRRGDCKNTPEPGVAHCKHHRCPTPGCGNGKAGKDAACASCDASSTIGERRGTQGHACAYVSDRGDCKTATKPGSLHCKRHACPTAGCRNGKAGADASCASCAAAAKGGGARRGAQGHATGATPELDEDYDEPPPPMLSHPKHHDEDMFRVQARPLDTADKTGTAGGRRGKKGKKGKASVASRSISPHMAANSISFGSPHVRPMGCTCGA